MDSNQMQKTVDKKHDKLCDFTTESIQNMHKHQKLDYVPPVHPIPNQTDSKPGKAIKESHFTRDLKVYSNHSNSYEYTKEYVVCAKAEMKSLIL